MDHLVHVLEVVLLAAGADVALAVPVAAQVALVAGHQQVVPDVELTPVVQERLYVLLDYQRTQLGTARTLSAQQGHQGCSLDDLDAVAAVGVLAWLHDPHLLGGPVSVDESLEGERVVDADGPRQDGEGVELEHFGVVPGDDFEEDAFGADDAVERNVVGDLADGSLGKAGNLAAVTSFIPFIRQANL